VDVLVPPSIKREARAYAVVMIKKSGLLKEDLAIDIDYGINAEMALNSGSEIYMCSATAGPVI
jgi:uncharacterized 2Fe-2S/4Fe-4S cluster protein (DUF4445 family)